MPKQRRGRRAPSTHGLIGGDRGDIRSAALAFLQATDVVFITGCGISASSGIPTFRGDHWALRTPQNEGGHTIADEDQEEESEESEASSGAVQGKTIVKDTGLPVIADDPRVPPVEQNFHRDVLFDEARCPTFLSEVRRLIRARMTAEPTAFHRLIADTAAQGRLLRHYTQNIDDLESDLPLIKPQERVDPGLGTKKPKWAPTVQLHGSITWAICTNPLCELFRPLTLDDMEGPQLGYCEMCIDAQFAQITSAKRLGRVGLPGKVRPMFTLYGEIGYNEEATHQTIESDLQRKPGMLVVAGTSLRTQGPRSTIRKFAQRVRTLAAATKSDVKRSGMKTIWINKEQPPGFGTDHLYHYVLLCEASVFAATVEACRRGISEQHQAVESGSGSVSRGSAEVVDWGRILPEMAYPLAPPEPVGLRA